MDRKAIMEIVETNLRRGYHYDTLKLVRELLAEQPSLQDEVAAMYLERGERGSFHAYEDFLRAAEYLPFGLSEPVRERMLRDFVKEGFHHRAWQLAEDLGRSLSVSEVQQLVDVYTHGCLRSDSEETELKSLAFQAGGMLLEEWTMRQIVSMHERWDHEGLR